MSIRAASNSKFLRRFLLIAAVCYGYVLWGAYDALVTGPKELKKARIYWVNVTKGEKPQWEPQYSNESGKWTEIVKENNWDIGAPKTPTGAQGFLYFNYALVAICLVAGSIATFKYVKTNNTWVEADNGKLRTSWGEEFAIKDIESIDKAKWAHKGVAKITYASDEGPKLFVLDDFKYVREETDTILFTLEQDLKDDQILNGERELSPKARADAKRSAEEQRKKLDVVEDEE